MISSLTFSICLFYLFMGVIASAVLLTSSARFTIKIVVPSLIVALACATLHYLPEALGYPVETTAAGLPQQAELIAFHPYDDEKRVDLWLTQEGATEPRAYSVELTDDLKKTLKEAKQKLAGGERAELVKRKAGKGKYPPGYIDIDGGSAPYELLPNAFNLPAKGTS